MKLREQLSAGRVMGGGVVWWGRGLIVGVLVMAGWLMGVQMRQAEARQAALLEMRAWREARLDLAKGFLHFKLGAGRMVYAMEQGQAWLEQGMKGMERMAAETADGEAVVARAEELRVQMAAWRSRTEGAGEEAELRAAFFGLEREAEKWDGRLRDRFGKLEAGQRRQLGWAGGVAGLGLAGLCLVVLALQQTGMRAERELRLREARFRRVAESLPQLVWTCTVEGACDYVSRRWLDYTGETLADQRGEGWVEVLHEEDRAGYLAGWGRAVETQTAFRAETRLRRADGVYRWFDVRALPLRDEDGVVRQWLGASTDIQDAHELTVALSEEREFSDALLDALPGVFYLYGQDGRFIRWNRNFERVTGYSGEEIARMRSVDFFEEKDHARLAERVAEVFEKGESEMEGEFRSKDGRLTPYYFTGVRVERKGVTCLAGVGINISELKRAQEALKAMNVTLESRVAQRTAELEAKNRELETFTYSVSHDLKAPLRGIDGYSRLLLEDHQESLNEEGRKFLGSVRQASVQMGRLIDDLLAYSQIERRQLMSGEAGLKVAVEHVVAEAGMAIAEVGAGVRVRVPEGARVMLDPGGFNLVLRNLLDNGMKFARPGVVPQIEVTAEEEEGCWVLAVKDEGIGFEMKFVARIFDIFQRLHRSEDYPGTGIGLAIVRKAMERMGGEVWAESVPGEGATFFLKFPKPTKNS